MFLLEGRTKDHRTMPPVPLDTRLYALVKSDARRRFARWPSAYASAWLSKEYKRRRGTWKSEMKASKNGTSRWMREKWIQVGHHRRDAFHVDLARTLHRRAVRRAASVQRRLLLSTRWLVSCLDDMLRFFPLTPRRFLVRELTGLYPCSTPPSSCRSRSRLPPRRPPSPQEFSDRSSIRADLDSRKSGERHPPYP